MLNRLTNTPLYRSRCVALLVLAGSLFLASCERNAPATGATTTVTPAATAADGTTPILTVNGRTLSRAEFEAAFVRSLPNGQAVTPEERSALKRAFLVQMIDRKLTLAEAEKLHLSVTPQEVEQALREHQADYPAAEFEKALQMRNLTMEQWRVELQEKLLMEKVLLSAVYARVEPSLEEQQAYYEEHRADYDRPVQVRARQIVVAEEVEGQRVLGLLRQGESFATVAKAHSLSPDAEQGGDLGYFAEGEMPLEFDQVVFKLQPGRLSDLIKTEYGYHIFLVEDKRAAQQLPFADVQQEIHRTLKIQKEETAYHQWLQDLRADARIEVNWDQL